MKLLALHLGNVRKFTGKRASITGIGDGITVVSEANEFGKSTFFDAIHALFFEKYSSAAKSLKSLQPYAGGAVEVAAEVQTNAGRFRVEKRFLARKSARVSRLDDGATIAQDDEAERWIAEVLGGAGDGPAGLLWVRQGLVGLEPDSARDKAQGLETRRDLLSSVAGEIDAMTGGRRMDRVMRRVADALGDITTRTGRKAGAWKAASDNCEALEAELSEVSAQVQALDTALSARKQVEDAVKRLENPDTTARRDAALSAAQVALDTARAHVGAVNAARQDRDLAALKAASAQSELDAFLAALAALDTARKQAAVITSRAAEAMSEAERLKGALASAQARHSNAVAAVTDARKHLDAVRRQTAARKARDLAAQLGRQIAKAEAALGNRDVARARVKASGATSDWLRRVEQADGEMAKLAARVAAQATTLSITYEGAARIMRDGVALPADQPVALEGDTRLDLPGIGQMTVRAQVPDGDGKARLTAARDSLAARLRMRIWRRRFWTRWPPTGSRRCTARAPRPHWPPPRRRTTRFQTWPILSMPCAHLRRPRLPRKRPCATPRPITVTPAKSPRDSRLRPKTPSRRKSGPCRMPAPKPRVTSAVRNICANRPKRRRGCAWPRRPWATSPLPRRIWTRPQPR
jgi:hypothetical protein